MKYLGIARRVDDLGRIVLPIELRRQFGIEAGDSLDIAIDPETRSIVLRKPQDECVFCGSQDSLRDHRGRRVCRTCVNELGGAPRPGVPAAPYPSPSS